MPAKVARHDAIDVGPGPASDGNPGEEQPEALFMVQEENGVADGFICKPASLDRSLRPDDDFGLSPTPAAFLQAGTENPRIRRCFTRGCVPGAQQRAVR